MSEQDTQQVAARQPARERFERAEITRVLEHYGTGDVSSVRELIAGSSSAPKAVIECGRGKLLLKRRAPGLDHAPLVGFAHEIVLGCLARGVCVPPLIGTKAEHNSMCQIADRTYELFVFIDGTPYARTPEQARSTGAVLAELHAAASVAETTFEPSVESTVIDAARPGRMGLAGEERARVDRILGFALEAHDLNAPGPGVVHGDWHPGNMIYGDGELIAVCDFDNTRLGSRSRELAQSLVYFSMRAPSEHDDALNPDMLAAVWGGYTAAGGAIDDVRLLVALMPAVILDEALGATETGDADPKLFGLAMRKAAWLDEHRSELEGMLRNA